MYRGYDFALQSFWMSSVCTVYKTTPVVIVSTDAAMNTTVGKLTEAQQ